MHTASIPEENLLRIAQVEARVGLKRSSIYAGMKAGSFPKCVKLSPRAAAWPSSSIDRWIADRIAGAARSESMRGAAA
jgi:prophage regulatory protein